jgi:hypothetical protein
VPRVLFDTSMLYIDHSAKRGVYYFTLNLLKYLSRYGNEVKANDVRDLIHNYEAFAKVLG